MASLDLFGHQMRNNLGIGFALERPPTRSQFVTQLLEILDNPIVDQSDLASRMGMSIGGRRRAMRRPARVGDTDIAGGEIIFEDIYQIDELTFGSAPNEIISAIAIVVDGANAGAIIPPVFHAFQAFNKPIRNLHFSNNADNSTHKFYTLSGVM
jgi:hypothetical protein